MKQKGDRKEPNVNKVLKRHYNQCGCSKAHIKEKQYRYKYEYKFKYQYRYEHKRGNTNMMSGTKEALPCSGMESGGGKETMGMANGALLTSPRQKEPKVNQRNPKADQKETMGTADHIMNILSVTKEALPCSSMEYGGGKETMGMADCALLTSPRQKEPKVNQRGPKADQKEPKVDKGEPEVNLKEQGNIPMKIVGGSDMQVEVSER